MCSAPHEDLDHSDNSCSFYALFHVYLRFLGDIFEIRRKTWPYFHVGVIPQILSCSLHSNGWKEQKSQ